MTSPNDKYIDKISSVWLEEYKALAGDIGRRVDLQHKNLSLHLIFLSAIASYLFKYGVDNGFQQILANEIVILVAITPFISQVFTWRHLDHDSNIIDKASYIESVICPNVNELLEQGNLLGFEKYLAISRKKRINSVGPFAILGNDHAITVTYAILYLTLAWVILLKYKIKIEGIADIFRYLITFSSFSMLITIYMVVRNVIRYRNILSFADSYSAKRIEIQKENIIIAQQPASVGLPEQPDNH